MTLTPFPEEAARNLPRPWNEPTRGTPLSSMEEKHFNVRMDSIEEKNAESRIESIASGTASPGDSMSKPSNECLKTEIYSTPFGQPEQREVLLDPFGLPLSP